MSTTFPAGPKPGTLFLHEIRTAIRENRWILPVPTLFMLAVVLASRRAWNPAGGGPPGWDLIGPITTLNDTWPWLAWVFPWLILKRPDPADPTAFWRALPSGVAPVFGGRLAVAVIFTVILPALALGGGLGLQTPEFFWPQTGETLLRQCAFLWIGAFAAFSAKGYKGVGRMAVLVALWQIGRPALREAYRLYVEKAPAGPYSGYPLPDLSEYFWEWIIPALGPVWIVWKLRRPVAPARLSLWIPGVVAALLAGPVVQAFWRPVVAAEKLPVFKAGMGMSVYSSGFSGGGNFYVRGRKDLRKRLGDVSNEFPRPDCYPEGGIKWGRMSVNWSSVLITGSWSTGDASGDLDFRTAYPLKPTLKFEFMRRTGVPDLRDDRPLGNVLNCPDIQLTKQKGHQDKKTKEWVTESLWRTKSEAPEKPLVEMEFQVPTPENASVVAKPPMKTFYGKTVTIRAEVPMFRKNEPRVALRAPLRRGGLLHNGIEHIGFAGYAGVFDEKYGAPHQLLIDIARNPGPQLPSWISSKRWIGGFQGCNYSLFLLNPKTGQMVALKQSENRDASDVLLMFFGHNEDSRFGLGSRRYGETGCSMAPSKEDRALLTKQWLDDADLVVLDYSADTPVSLPVELTLQVPAEKDAAKYR